MKSGKDWKFRTEVSPEPLRQPIALRDKILTLGSCFADQIGNRLGENKFNVEVNPTGTVYNPVSLHRLIKAVIENSVPDTSRFVQRDHCWYSLEFHSSFFGSSEKELYQKLLDWNVSTKEIVTRTDVFILTYGTAWVYKTDNSSEPVTNCQKMPGKNFSKHLLAPEEIHESFTELYRRMASINPNARWILTVSPVRHIKDSLPLNAVSKSVLRLACHRISELPNVYYFPAFEIMTDDLRDYRFYAADLIHPSETALDYLWESFREVALQKSEQELVDRWEKIRKGLHHKPFNPSGSDYKKFLENLNLEMIDLSTHMNLSAEIHQVKKILADLQ